MIFMEHDAWKDALFLHWRLDASADKEVLACLARECPFSLDVDDEGATWVGLVLLTEVNVGPPSPLRRITPAVTHYGVNVRTCKRHKHP
jgi:uncharacterized protein YqjF (DUF2071 family)